MTRSSTTKLELFDHKIERTFHHLGNLVEAKFSPKKQHIEMEDTSAPIGAGAVGA